MKTSYGLMMSKVQKSRNLRRTYQYLVLGFDQGATNINPGDDTASASHPKSWIFL